MPGQSVETIAADSTSGLDPLQEADPTLRTDPDPPPSFFKGRLRLVMEPVDVPLDSAVVQAIARHHQSVTRRAAAVIGALLPMSYSAGDSSWL